MAQKRRPEHRTLDLHRDERGVKWLAEVNAELDTHSFGVLCVTPGNVSAPWLNYEAGALAKHLGDSGRVIPYLLDFHSPSDLREPLAQFNASLADEDGTWHLVKTLNKHAEFKLDEAALLEAFGLWWPKLEVRLSEIAASSTQIPARRQIDDKIDELLDIVRDLRRTNDLMFVDSVDSRVIQPESSGGGEATAARRIAIDDVRATIRETLGQSISDKTLIQWSRGNSWFVLVGHCLKAMNSRFAKRSRTVGGTWMRC